MKVVIDTNVLVSAALKDRNPESVILCILTQPQFEWIVTDEILKEYKEVLARPKFSLPAPIVQQWWELLDEFTAPVAVEISFEFPRDRKDAKFLACALAANAEFFITGDRDFNEAQKLVETLILSASMFKQMFCDESDQ